jgi:Predicted endonuclease distantly related to archaeal Holliday junction resolvase and Mrr-like restriction enzymes
MNKKLKNIKDHLDYLQNVAYELYRVADGSIYPEMTTYKCYDEELGKQVEKEDYYSTLAFRGLAENIVKFYMLIRAGDVHLLDDVYDDISNRIIPDSEVEAAEDVELEEVLVDEEGLAVYTSELVDLEVKPEELLNVLNILRKSFDDKELYSSPLLEIPQVIIDVRSELLEFISKRPELLYSVAPRLFEKIIAEIFRKFNMTVMLTKQTRDGGQDIIAFDDSRYTQNKYIIECKRYAPAHKIGIDIVQRLLGVKIANKATKAFMVTTSDYTKPAREFANNFFWELDLKDFSDICKWLRLFWPNK